MRVVWSMLWLIGTVLLCADVASGQQGAGAPDDQGLGDLSLEELMDVEITSVSKKAQRLSDAMGAIYVVTSEEIRRSGATTIPDVLRAVPGLQVARLNGTTFAIAVRGFGGQFSNKLLVLIDGRSVYTPVYSGVYWDSKDVLLEDVERVEVVRGPGGALWGSNAVNGVINIITKSATKTQGTLVYAGAGTEERVMAGGRFGFKLDANTAARIYTKFFDRDGLVNAAGANQPDDWSMKRVGFRLDHQGGEHTLTTFQGDYYRGRSDSVNNIPLNAAPYVQRQTLRERPEGGNLLARWSRDSASGVHSSVQTYFDYISREGGTGNQRRRTFDIEGQWRTPFLKDHEIMAGLGYRVIHSDLGQGQIVRFDDRGETDQLFSGFLRGEFDLVKDKLTIALGAKIEHNEYSGLEGQPEVRLRWRAARNQTFWAAYSRAVRVPSRIENDIDAILSSKPGPGGLAVQSELRGNRSLDSEEVRAAELGYRVQVVEDLSLDVTGFYDKYDNLITGTLVGAPQLDPSVPRIVQNLSLSNGTDGETYGFEVAGHWRARDNLSIAGGYSFLRVELHSKDTARWPLWRRAEHSSPRNQAHVRMNLNASEHVEFDTALYYVDSLSSQGVGAYVRWDARVGWHPSKSSEASLVFQNLLDDRHSEYGTIFTQQPTQSQRSVYLKFTTRF